MKLWPHHERAIASLIEEVEARPDTLALVLGGSLARGWGQPGSDLDGHLVFTDDAIEQRQRNAQLAFIAERNHCDWEGGYVDMKAVSRGLLEAAAEHASEPWRNAYVGVKVLWCRDPDEQPEFEDLFRRVATYPEAGHAEKVLQLASHLRGMHWYIGEAQKRDDRYLQRWCAQRVVLLSCRLVLAENRVLYPYHKWLMRSVEACAKKPDGFVAAAKAAADSTDAETVRAAADLALGWREWGDSEAWWEPWIARSEFAWRHGPVSVDEM